MNAEDLDLAYTHLCQALARVGEAQAPVFLAMLSLSLMARAGAASEVLPLLEQAERACETVAA